MPNTENESTSTDDEGSLKEHRAAIIQEIVDIESPKQRATQANFEFHVVGKDFDELLAVADAAASKLFGDANYKLHFDIVRNNGAPLDMDAVTYDYLKPPAFNAHVKAYFHHWDD